MYFLCRDKNPRSLLSFLFIVILLIVILDESGVTGELPAHEGQPTVSQTTVSVGLTPTGQTSSTSSTSSTIPTSSTSPSLWPTTNRNCWMWNICSPHLVTSDAGERGDGGGCHSDTYQGKIRIITQLPFFESPQCCLTWSPPASRVSSLRSSEA